MESKSRIDIIEDRMSLLERAYFARLKHVGLASQADFNFLVEYSGNHAETKFLVYSESLDTRNLHSLNILDKKDVEIIANWNFGKIFRIENGESVCVRDAKEEAFDF